LSVAILYGISGWKYVFAAFFVFSLLLLLFQVASKKKLVLSNYVGSLLLLIVIITAAVIYPKREKFSIQNRQEKNWIDMQLWAKANSNPDAVFIVPPYMEGFRIESERTVYCDWKDGTLLNFNPAFGLEWLRRMEQLGYEKKSSREDGFRNLTEKNFTSIAEDIAATDKSSSIFLITEKENTALYFPQLYENQKFTAYKIR
jgi:hypothetical protein